jgi:DNA-binding FadR family transcriptional regulator
MIHTYPHMAKSDAMGERYLQSVKERGYENLKCTVAELTAAKLTAKTPEALIRVLCAEGAEIIAAEEKAKTPPVPPSENKRLQDALAASTKNPYVRARLKILNDLTKDRRDQIEGMEKNGKTNNPTYEQFIKMVTKLGDDFSK